MPAAVFVLTMRAVAGPANAEPDGRRYDLLVFARGDDETEAQVRAGLDLERLGWTEPQTLRCGEIIEPQALPDDFRASFRRAQEGGCAVIVYDQP